MIDPPTSTALEIDADDHGLEGVLGKETTSERQVAVRYRPLKRIGEGGSAIAFLALRVGPEGECPVVLKVLRPSIVRQLGEKAVLAVRKEAVSLGRLNEQTPPTPFVVRLLDAGMWPVIHAGRRLQLAWLAVEYVHGGPEGTTLTARVTATIDATGAAFRPARAARVLECLSAGLAAVHGVSIIHRDFKPDNVLSCGADDSEVFKLADFGIARPDGMAATFGLFVGTPGYAAPELAGLKPEAIGTWTDVFGLGCTMFFVLTGEPYFELGTPAYLIALARLPERRSVLACEGLCPELRAEPEACRAIDAVLARATAPEPRDRTPSAGAVAAELLPILREVARRRPSARHRIHLVSTDETVLGGWSWSILQQPVPGWTVRSVAWDVDGRCLALSSGGLFCWDGIAWRHMAIPGIGAMGPLRFVHGLGAGRWLLGGEAGTMARYDEGGVTDVVRGDPALAFALASGDLEDIAVLLGAGASGQTALFVLVGRRWMRPFSLPEVGSVTALVRVDDARWLVAGSAAVSSGHLSVFAPLDRELLPLGPSSPPLLAAAGDPSARLGIAVGEGGTVVRWAGGEVTRESVPDEPRLSAAALDTTGGAWVGGEGTLWKRSESSGAVRWTPAWAASHLRAPFVSISAAPGLVRAVAADGAVVEGRYGG